MSFEHSVKFRSPRGRENTDGQQPKNSRSRRFWSFCLASKIEGAIQIATQRFRRAKQLASHRAIEGTERRIAGIEHVM
jgi:hypothetical protein